MWKLSEDEFNIDFMKEHNYMRHKCKICGAFFWGTGDMDICGESPCVKYTFLDNPPTRRRYSLREMRDTFLKFFEKRGHEIINPYPVIARWRDDLLITIASIADFQPYVTGGVSDPPANPLVISQPCLRFEDMDKVGLTSGRHLTIFEMGGAHAFNRVKENKFIYWKNKTVEFHHEFATVELGIPEDLITYKEHFWVGGGNAGPDLEGIISGLEVSTLVFMRYRVLPDGTLEDIPIWTVDTGYGIERWTWLSTGYPTAFEAIYSDVYRWILNRLDLSISKDALKMITLYFSGVREPRFETLFKDIVNRVSQDLGYDAEVLREDLRLFVDAMKLLDFSKSSLFLIKDGGIPSNVKEGYLTRMLLRRIFRIVKTINLDESFIEELFRKQYNYWERDYPELRDVRDTLYDIIFFEYDKYQDVLKKAPKVVKYYLNKKGIITLDSLIEIYDSYGIPPEVIKNIYSKHGGSIKIPDNFTELVSKRHMEKSIKTTESEIEKFPEGFSTQKVYYLNSYWRSLVAKVVHSTEKYVILDKTIFYPGEGGQQHDTGYIIDNMGNRYRVEKVIAYKNSIIHFISPQTKNLKAGDYVRLEIDWDRRYSLMKHHTATHVLLSAIRQILGKHVWQAGAEKTPEYSRLDVTHYKLPSIDELRMIEMKANKVIAENREVRVHIMERGAAEKKYGPVIYQGGVVPGKYLRIIEVEGWDVEACGGTHVRRTGELLYIKIDRVEKIHDGVIRFIFRVGEEAIRYMWNYYEISEKLKNILSTSLDNLINKVNSLMEEMRRNREYMTKLEKTIMRYKARDIIAQSIYVNGLRVIVEESNKVDELIMLSEEIDRELDDYIFIGYAEKGRGVNIIVKLGDEYIRKGFSALDIIDILRTDVLKGGGKGNKKYARIGGKGKVTKDILLEVLRKYVRRERQ